MIRNLASLGDKAGMVLEWIHASVSGTILTLEEHTFVHNRQSRELIASDTNIPESSVERYIAIIIDRGFLVSAGKKSLYTMPHEIYLKLKYLRQ